MSDVDVRDERVGRALDAVVRGVDPRRSAQGVIRRGSWRRAGRVAGSVALVAAFLGATLWAGSVFRAGREGRVAGTVTFTSGEALWTFEYPSDWRVTTSTSPSPDLVGLLRTTVANGPLPENAGASGPDAVGSAELTSALGEGGAVVLVQRQCCQGGPLEGEPAGPGEFREDSESPGWTFRERYRCDGTLCMSIVEWLGPGVTQEDRDAAASIAGSVRRGGGERWTETDGTRTTLHDEDDGFTVTFPADWIASDRRINTWVDQPFEILALATYPLRPGGEAVIDAQVPSHAIEDLGPDDIFIWLNDGGDGKGFPDRPPAFGPSEPCDGWDRLCQEPSGRTLGIPGIRGWWLGFRDAGRGFYVFVGMGERAYDDPARARLPWEVLDSLQILPR